MRKQIYRSLFSIIFTMLAHVGYPQHNVNVVQSTLTINGTSTFHKWTMELVDFEGKGIISQPSDKEIEITDSHFRCAVNAIRSSEKKMTQKAHAALNEPEYPEIILSGKHAVLHKVSAHSFNGKLIGMLSIAGITKEKEIEIEGTRDGDDYRLGGSVEIHMNEFGIHPPRALLGTIKTGNMVIVSFSFKLVPQNDGTRP